VTVRLPFRLGLLVAFAGCRVLSGGLEGQGLGGQGPDTAPGPEVSPPPPDGPPPALDVGEPPGVVGLPPAVGCSDGTREGFRDVLHWPNIAGCAGGFEQPGVLGSPTPSSACYQAGDSSLNPNGIGCGAADLCAAEWHVCGGAADVARHSPTGDCESCVLPGELRFFLVAAGASPMGICTPDPEAANDLHGCGGLGQPESDACAPLVRRMGFADCLATRGVWHCGGEPDSLREAAIVTKPGVGMGGVLCCKN
jgi:hypothetical protein